MKRTRRILSFLLALVMILPMLSVMTMAEEAPKLLWAGENFDAGSMSSLSTYPSTAQIVSKDALNVSDKALKIDIKGVAASSRTKPYYAWTSHTAIYEITDYTYDAATNTVKGKFNNGSATYDISGTLDTGVKATCSAGTYYVYTPEMVDARSGSTNVARAAVIKNPLINTTTTDKAVFQYKIWFENGSKGVFASRAITTGGKYIEFFGLKATGSSVTLQAHENGLIVSGAAVTFKTEEWHTISVALDLNDMWYDVYLDGVYAFSTTNRDGASFELPMPFNINATKWNLIQINRGNASASALAGSLMIDDVCIYDGSILDTFTGAPAVEKTDDFESYTVDHLTTANGYNTARPAEMVAYNKILTETVSGSANKFVRVPLLYDGTGSNVIGTAGYTNYDKTLMLGHSKMTKANGEYAVFEIDYRHNAEANCTNGTIETQLRTFNFDAELSNGATIDGTAVTNTVHNKSGLYLTLFTIHLKDGSIVGHDTKMTKTGAAGLKENEWNTIRYVLNLRDTSYYLYVNGILYGYDDAMESVTDSNWKACTKVSNISIPANNLIISKVNKKDVSFNKVEEADSTYSNVNYIDIDNVSLTSTNEAPKIVMPPVSAGDDFEGYAEGTRLTTSHGYNTANTTEIVAYNKILSETLAGGANKFVRLPLIYDGTGENDIKTVGYTNRDKTLQLNHGLINTNTGKYAVFTVDYRPHAEDDNGSAATIEVQLRNYTFDALIEKGSQKQPTGGAYADLAADEKGITGLYLNLFTITPASGEVKIQTGQSTKTGAPGLKEDEWNRVQYVMNLEDGSSSLYVNGKLYSTAESPTATSTTSSGWVYYSHPSNFNIPSNKLIIAKLNHKDSAGNPCYDLAADADENYSNVNYIDLDNVSFASATEKDIVTVPDTNAEGESLMYVEVGGAKVPSKNLYLTDDLDYSIKYFDPATLNCDGILSTVNKSSVRLKSPAGLRFVTEIVDVEKLDALFALEGEDYMDVEFGTLIVPASYLDSADFTVESLTAAGKKYLTVAGEYGHYYRFDNDDSTTHFVGSIVNLLSTNIARDFAATGYIKITLWSGAEYYFYAGEKHTASVQQIAQLALNDTSRNWGAFETSILSAYAAGNTLDTQIEADLNGMNVLALGDSLFAGTDEGTPGCDRASQWVNLLGNNHNWTLTNLGIGGMTVSLTENNYDVNHGKKASMYDWLFNDVNDFRWGTSYNTNSGYLYHPNYGSNYRYNYYYNCGDFTGKSAEDVELILLEGGCNDYGTAIAAPLGTIDSKDPGTFLGAWNCVVERLLEQYPNATIVFITTWYLNPQSRPNDTLTSIEYSTSVNRLYEANYANNDRVQLIDAGDPAVSGVDMRNAEWRTEYSNDAYHLKNSGMQVMADHMRPLIWEIVMRARDAK